MLSLEIGLKSTWKDRSVRPEEFLKNEWRMFPQPAGELPSRMEQERSVVVKKLELLAVAAINPLAVDIKQTVEAWPEE